MKEPAQIKQTTLLKHLLQIENLSPQTLLTILASAQNIIDLKQHQKQLITPLRGETLVNLFFETSTRTRISFELAAKRLGAAVINLESQFCAAQKGETLLDTLYTLRAMYCRFFVIRHPENNALVQIASQINQDISIINAGDGCHAHPTQALQDILTMQQVKPNFPQLTVAIVGDLRHSRVARSLISALLILNVAQIRIIGPKHLLLDMSAGDQIIKETELTKGLQGVDVIVMLRIQKERFNRETLPDFKSYFNAYGLTQEKLALAKPDAIVMHPGPINRGVEIALEVAYGRHSVITQQVSNGIAVRMAILRMLNLS